MDINTECDEASVIKYEQEILVKASCAVLATFL